MSGSDGGGNRTVFRPSPLQQRGQSAPGDPQQPPAGWGAPPPPVPAPASMPAPPAPMAYAAPVAPAPVAAPVRLGVDDIPQPATPRVFHNRLLAAASPVLALAASVRAGRARTPIPELHRQMVAAIQACDQAIAGQYPEETRMRAKYAVCATADDVVQNLPGLGADGAEWARRSMVVTFFHENIGGDRFWQLARDPAAPGGDSRDLAELYHACLAAGFEGKYRVLPNGRRGLHEEMTALFARLDHARSISTVELVPHWRGETAPPRRVGLWSHVALAAAAAAAFLLVVFIVLRLLLMASGGASHDAVAAINPAAPLRLSRSAAPPPAPPASGQLEGLKKFLEPERRQGLVTVEEDASTVRVRTTEGQLFASASDQLEPGRRALFERIGDAVQQEKGQVTVEGHADSDRVASLSFPDNMALSAARAETVAAILRSRLSDAGRVVAKGYGDTRPIASNDTPAGKSENRRVEIVVPRRN